MSTGTAPDPGGHGVGHTDVGIGRARGPGTEADRCHVPGNMAVQGGESDADAFGRTACRFTVSRVGPRGLSGAGQSTRVRPTAGVRRWRRAVAMNRRAARMPGRGHRGRTTYPRRERRDSRDVNRPSDMEHGGSSLRRSRFHNRS